MDDPKASHLFRLRPRPAGLSLLEMTEAVIAAHQAAIRDGDDEVVAWLQVALRHLEVRLRTELAPNLLGAGPDGRLLS